MRPTCLFAILRVKLQYQSGVYNLFSCPYSIMTYTTSGAIRSPPGVTSDPRQTPVSPGDSLCRAPVSNLVPIKFAKRVSKSYSWKRCFGSCKHLVKCRRALTPRRLGLRNISVNTDSLSPSITTNPLHDYSVTGCFIQALGSCQYMTKFCNHLNHLMQSSYGIYLCIAGKFELIENNYVRLLSKRKC